MSGNEKSDRELDKYHKIALDSNIFIYYFEKHPEFFEKTRSIFTELEQNNFSAITSIISLTEMLSYPLSQSAITTTIDSFYSTPHLKIFELDRAIAIEAARIRREYRFRLPDSIQLATALSSKAQAFITNDQRLKSFKKLKIILLENLS